MSSDNSGKLLSICIPTRGRTEVLIDTLQSIFQSSSDPSLYEVVIYDSSDTASIENILHERFKANNLLYVKGQNFGYLNLIEAMKLGTGNYLKMHNDYSIFADGSINIMINEIRKSVVEKPLLLFSNGSLGNEEVKTYQSFDKFQFDLSYYSTWSNVFGMWRRDLEHLTDQVSNPMFPHTSLLFAMSFKERYIINDRTLFKNIDIENKGGYNLFEVFAEDFLGMVEQCFKASLITCTTFNHIKKDMLYNFFVPWYAQTKILKNNYTFSLTGIRKSIKTHYSEFEYLKMIFLAYRRSTKITLKELLKKR